MPSSHGRVVTAVVDLFSPFERCTNVMRESGLRVWIGPSNASARNR
jgi:hypothetical protein